MDIKKRGAALDRVTAFGVVRIAGYSVGGLFKPLEGKKGQIVVQIKGLHREMKVVIRNEDYEKAALLRDSIQELAKTIKDIPDDAPAEVLDYKRTGNTITIEKLKVNPAQVNLPEFIIAPGLAGL